MRFALVTLLPVFVSGGCLRDNPDIGADAGEPTRDEMVAECVETADCVEPACPTDYAYWQDYRDEEPEDGFSEEWDAWEAELFARSAVYAACLDPLCPIPPGATELTCDVGPWLDCAAQWGYLFAHKDGEHVDLCSAQFDGYPFD